MNEPQERPYTSPRYHGYAVSVLTRIGEWHSIARVGDMIGRARRGLLHARTEASRARLRVVVACGFAWLQCPRTALANVVGRVRS